MTNTTRWKLDTCDCVIEYDWEINDIDTHKLRKITKCDAHKHLKDEDAYVQAKQDNKNKVKKN